MKNLASLRQKANQRILLIAEDTLKGFQRDPIAEIARKTGLKPETVIRRIRAMMKAGVIRRVRQTVMTIKLVPGALVAWKIPEKKLLKAFEWISKKDPFSGHVVIRRAEYSGMASQYRLWTTLKVPLPFSLEKHCKLLKKKVGAEKFHIMPAKGVFALSVGHLRRRNLAVGARFEADTAIQKVQTVKLSRLEWKVLKILKREFTSKEIQLDIWKPRAKEAKLSFEKFCEVAKRLERKGVLGRFSTFLEHSKKVLDESPLVPCHALLQWAVPRGKEEKVGALVASYRAVTHCYWRETPPEFCGINIMAMIHGDSEKKILKHKEAIDRSFRSRKIPILYSNIFWSEKSDIKPSEFDSDIYRQWLRGINKINAA